MCSFSDSCHNSTNSSLITVDYQLHVHFLALLCTRPADLVCMHVVLIHSIVQSVLMLMPILVITLYSTLSGWAYKFAIVLCRLAIATQYWTANISASRVYLHNISHSAEGLAPMVFILSASFITGTCMVTLLYLGMHQYLSEEIHYKATKIMCKWSQYWGERYQSQS